MTSDGLPIAEFHLARRQRRGFALLSAFVGFWLPPNLTRLVGELGPETFGVGAVLAVLFGVGQWVIGGRRSTVVDTAGVRTTWIGRGKRRTWDEITEVSVENRGAVKIVWLMGQRPIKLTVPHSLKLLDDPDFDERIAELSALVAQRRQLGR